MQNMRNTADPKLIHSKLETLLDTSKLILVEPPH